MNAGDVYIQMIANYARISPIEARFIFDEIQHELPTREGFEKKLSNKEFSAMLRVYNRNQEILQLIARLVDQTGRRPGPRA